jgi:hypothetical protein
MAAYHKVARVYLGVRSRNRRWQATGGKTLMLEDRLALARGLWDMGIHETMVAAAKLLEQARIRPDDSAAWALIAGWAEGFDGLGGGRSCQHLGAETAGRRSVALDTWQAGRSTPTCGPAARHW